MARKPNGQTAAQPEPEPTRAPSPEGATEGNCTDETKREFYRKALIAKIGLESAQETARKKNGEYRNVLKDAKKAGVDSKAITDVLALRFNDPDLVLIEERERLKMLDLSGLILNIKGKLLARLDVEEPTRNEQHQMTLDRAYDGGVFAYREGQERDLNPHVAGSEEYDAHDRGWLWLKGQQDIADEMAPARPPQQTGDMPEPPAPVH